MRTWIGSKYNEYLIGQTDLHFSREGMYPSWYGYVMRQKAPFKEDIDKWYKFSSDCTHMSHSIKILSAV